MSFRKYAALDVLEAWQVPAGDSVRALRKAAHRVAFDYTPRHGYLYVRSRMISSRCNDNHDEFPAAEIEKAYRSFLGKPVFVNHHNANHRRARGVIVAVALHRDRNPDGSPDTWVEGLMEVDALRFPKLAKALISKRIDKTSMGVDVEHSICSACGNKAESPADYCKHLPALKGKKIRQRGPDGKIREEVIREKCHGLSFFENSLLVEDPADPTAVLVGGIDTRGLAKAAALQVTAAPAGPHPGRLQGGTCRENCSYGGTHCLMCHEPVLVNLHKTDTASGGWYHHDGMRRDHPALPADAGAVMASVPAQQARKDQVREQVASQLEGQGVPRRQPPGMPPDPFTASRRTPDPSRTGSSLVVEAAPHPDRACPSCGTGGGEQLHLPIGGGQSVPSNLVSCPGCSEVYDATKSGDQARVDRELGRAALREHWRTQDRQKELFSHVTESDTHPQFTYGDESRVMHERGMQEHQNRGPGGVPLDPHGSEVGRKMYEHKRNRALTHSEPFEPPEQQRHHLSSLPPHMNWDAVTGNQDVHSVTFGPDAREPYEFPMGKAHTHDVCADHMGHAITGNDTSAHNDPHKGSCVYCARGAEGIEGVINQDRADWHASEGGNIPGRGRRNQRVRDQVESGERDISTPYNPADPRNDPHQAIDQRLPYRMNSLSLLAFFREAITGEEAEPGHDIWARPSGQKSPVADELRRRTAIGETTVPPQINTLRQEECPVCGESEVWTGQRCPVCGFVAPPDLFRDPDLDKAKELRENSSPDPGAGQFPQGPADEEAMAQGSFPDADGQMFHPDQITPNGVPVGGTGQGPDGLPQGPDGQPMDPNLMADPNAPADPDAPVDPDQLEEQGLGDEQNGETQEEQGEQEAAQGDEELQEAQDAATAVLGCPACGTQFQPGDQGAADGQPCPACGQAPLAAVDDGDDPEKDQEPQGGKVAMAVTPTVREAFAAQQLRTAALERENAALRAGLRFMARLAGCENELEQIAAQAMHRTADEMNPAQPVPDPPEAPPTETTEQALQPGSMGDVQRPGTEAGSTEHVPAAATTTAITPGVEIQTPPATNLIDVTAPTQGTNPSQDGGVPIQQRRIETDVRIDPDPLKAQGPGIGGAGNNGTAFPWTMDGGTAPSGEAKQAARIMGSMRLARLRVQARLATDELQEAARIQADASLDEAAMAREMELITRMAAAQPRQQRLPSRQATRSAPSMAPQAAMAYAPAGGSSWDDDAIFLD